MKTKELIELLRAQAREIAREGHNGWGNTMELAADELEELLLTNAKKPGAGLNENRN
jgi:hypothetical protein